MSKAKLLLFTTDTLPYALHNINILSFPEGLSYRFRYQKSHFSKEVLDRFSSLQKNPETLSGYVVFRFNDGTYFPYRKVELIRSFDCGTLGFFYVKLKGIVNISESTVADFTNRTNELLVEGERPPKKLVHLVEFKDDGLAAIEDVDERLNEAWTQSVDLLSKADNLKGRSFFRLELLKGLKKKEQCRPSNLSGDMRGYRLAPGQDYLVQFFEYTAPQPNEKEDVVKTFSISLKTDPNKAEITKPEEVVDGRFDMFELAFSTLPEASGDAAYLRIENSQGNEDKKLPTIYIPYCVSLSPVWKTIRPILLLASIIAFIDPKLVVWGIKGVLPNLPVSVVEFLGHFDKDKWIQVAAIILFALSFWNFSFRSTLKNIKDIFK